MCYSAQIRADYRKYVRMFGADMSLREFARLYWGIAEGSTQGETPKAMDAVFADPLIEGYDTIAPYIERIKATQEQALQQELFEQRKRFADAERALQEKTTKAATESLRIADKKIRATLRRLEDLNRTELADSDSRIYPGWYAPVMIVQDGQRILVPMRFRCRLPGWTAEIEKKKDGTYCARRDSLKTAWRHLFGVRHGVILADCFYEHVKCDGKNVILRFDPTPGEPLMLVCLWNLTATPGEPDLYSFAVITDEPPPEVAAAGHDRCIIPIKSEYVDASLNPDPADLAIQFAILDDRVRPYYEHEIEKAA